MKVLDTPPEAVFDSLTELAALAFKAPIALISLIDANRQWFKSCIGLGVRETSRDVAFCDHAIRQRQVLVIADATLDPRFQHNPLVTGEPGIRFYAGAPLITPEGDALGTLCIIDRTPRPDFGQTDQAQLQAMAASVTHAMLMRRDISDYQDLERDREVQHRLLRQADDLAGMGHWSWDPVTGVSTWSELAYRIHGFDPGSPPPDLSGVLSIYDPADATVLRGLLDRTFLSGEPFSASARITRSDGETRWLKTQGAALADEHGRVTRVYGTFLDITDIKVVDERLRENEARLDFLMRHSADLIIRADVEQGVTWISPNCAQYGYQPDELLGLGFSDIIHPGDVEKTRKLIWLTLAGEPVEDVSLREQRIRTKDGRWVWTENAPTVVRDATGAAVEIVSVRRNIEARKAAEAALARSEADFRLLSEKSNDIIVRTGWSNDQESHVIYVSPAVERVLGYRLGENAGGQTFDFIHPADVEAVLRSNLEQIAEGPDATPRVNIYRARHKDGRWIWLEGRPTFLFDPETGEAAEQVAVLRDVTAQKEAEEILRQGEERFRLLTEKSSDIIMRTSFAANGERTVTYVSPAVERVLGYRPEDFPQANALGFVHPDDADELRLSNLQQVAEGPGAAPRKNTYRVKHSDGRWIWLEGQPTFLFDDETGHVREMISVMRDVTAQKEADEALRQSEARYRLLAENATDVIVQVGADGVLTFVSPASERVFGYSPSEMTGAEMAGFIHSEHVQGVIDTILARVAAGPGAESTDIQFQMRRKDGQWIWIQGRPHIRFGDDGEYIGVQDVLRDITPQRQASEALAISEAHHRLLSDNSRDVILEVALGEPEQRAIRYASPSCLAIFGRPQAELIGRRMADFIHPDDLAAVRTVIDLLIAEGPSAPQRAVRYRIRNADGRWIRVEGRPSISFAADGTAISVQTGLRDIEAQVVAETALAESEARYRLLAENATDVIACYDADGVFTYLSPAIETALGYAPEELIGRRPPEIMHPDDVKPILRAFAAYVAAGPGAAPIRTEYRALHKDGRVVWLEAQPRAVFDPQTGRLVEFQDVVRDITKRKETEAALAKSELRHSLISENATDIITCSSVGGRLLYASPSLKTVTGYEIEALMEHKPAFLKCIHPDDYGPAIAHVQKLIAGEPVPSERLAYRFRRADGEWIWLECSPAVVRNAEGEAIEIVDVIRDVTAHLRLQAELEKARDAAEAAAAVKSDFLANMSHEIRTPLTAILGYSGMIEQRPELEPETRGYVERVVKAGSALLAIVNDVLDFSKLEAGQVVIKPRPAPAHGVARDALMLFAPMAEAKGLNLAFTEEGQAPDFVQIDADRVRQVLLNLIGNAVKFTETGDVRVVSHYDPVSQRFAVRVEDSGAGLSETQQAKLFQRFSQVDGSTTRKHGGTGLGLAICKGLVEAMGGEIGVTSRLGEGSVFFFEIPAPPAVAPQENPEAREAVGDGLEYLRLLVIDDNAVNRELARAILAPLGVEVSEASDGLAGLDLAQALPIDVILLDIRMPGLDGPEVLARLRAEPGPNQFTPVLAFTADIELDCVCSGASFDGVVRKPLVALELVEAIAGAIFAPEPVLSAQEQTTLAT